MLTFIMSYCTCIWKAVYALKHVSFVFRLTLFDLYMFFLFVGVYSRCFSSCMSFVVSRRFSNFLSLTLILYSLCFGFIDS